MLLAHTISRCVVVRSRVEVFRHRAAKRLGGVAFSRMYADREHIHSSTRHVTNEYKANAVDFGMGSRRQRSRSPVARAVGNPGELTLCFHRAGVDV